MVRSVSLVGVDGESVTDGSDCQSSSSSLLQDGKILQFKKSLSMNGEQKKKDLTGMTRAPKIVEEYQPRRTSDNLFSMSTGSCSLDYLTSDVGSSILGPSSRASA